jgi:molybdate transport system substrate-binding protein
LHLLVFVVLFASCTPSPSASKGTPVAQEHEAVLFSAAASAKGVLEELIAKFREKSSAEIKLNAGSSNGLANQIIAGSPVDLFLSANQQWADEVVKAGLAESSTPLLTNRLVLVVPSANPGAVRGPKDLLNESVKKIALAGENVPAGIYAGQALTKLELLDPLSQAGKIVRGQDVRSALSYVERGEAEAGIVYSTDVSAASGVKTVHEFDSALHDEIVYSLVLLKQSASRPAAKEFFQFLQSPDADETFQKFGFWRLTARGDSNGS